MSGTSIIGRGKFSLQLRCVDCGSTIIQNSSPEFALAVRLWREPLNSSSVASL